MNLTYRRLEYKLEKVGIWARENNSEPKKIKTWVRKDFNFESEKKETEKIRKKIKNLSEGWLESDQMIRILVREEQNMSQKRLKSESEKMGIWVRDDKFLSQRKLESESEKIRTWARKIESEPNKIWISQIPIWVREK